MKKFLTVLLALSVVFTYTVGTAFAAASTSASASEDALKEVAQDVKDSIAYDGYGYMKATDTLGEYISKTAVEERVGEIVDKYLAEIGSVSSNWDAEWAAVNDIAKFKLELFEGVGTEYEPIEPAIGNSKEWKANTYYAIYKNADDSVVTAAATYASAEKLADAIKAARVEVSGDATDKNAVTTYEVKWTTYSNTYAELFKKQYVIERDAAYAALSPDLTAYSASAKKAIQTVIDTQTTVIEDAVKNYETGTAAKNSIDVFKTAVDAVKAALKANSTIADDEEKIAEARKAANKALADASVAFKEAAEDHYKALTTAQAVSRLDSLDKDVDTMVAFFEAKLDATVLDAKDSNMDEAKEVVDALNAVKATIESTFKVNTKYNDGEFYADLAVLDEVDILNAYAEKTAAEMKAKRNNDGTVMYIVADVDEALAAALDAVADTAYAKVANNKVKLDKTVVDNEFKKVLPNMEYDLQAYKATVIGDITTEDYDKTNWSYDRFDKVEAIQDKAIDEILVATTKAAIDAIAEKATDDMDAILTKDQITEVKEKVDSRLTALGYTGDDGILTKYYDVTVGSKGYSPAIKTAAIKAAVDVFKDAVIAAENKDITYAEIDKIIAANRDEALAAIASVKTQAELDAAAKALGEQFKELPKDVTLADKETILAAQKAFDAYLEQPGTSKTDVTNRYLLANAMKDLMDLEVKAVRDQIRALPSTITVANAAEVEAAEAARDALIETYGNYDNGTDEFGTETGFAYYGPALVPSNNATLETALDKLEEARVKDAADKIMALGANPSVEAVEAARAAYDALTLENKLKFNDELYADLLRAEKAVKTDIINAVKALKVVKNHSVAGKGYIKIAWSTIGDDSVVDGYRVYRSTKKDTGYGTKPIFTTTGKTYKNTKDLKKGTRYYYKVRAYKVVDGKTYFSAYSNKAHRVAK